MLTAIAISVTLLAFGAHAVVPLRLARGARHDQQRWRLGASFLLLAAVGAGLLRFWNATDALAQAQVGLGGSRELLGLAVCAAVVAVLWADLLLLVGWRAVPASGWRLAAIVGMGGLVGVSLGAEVLLRSPLEAVTPWPVLPAVVCRLLLGIACGELLAPGRPVLAPLGSLGLLLYPLTVPGGLRATLLPGHVLAPLAAAAVVFLLARWAPARWHRGLLLAGLVLSAVAFTGLADGATQGAPPAPEPLPPNPLFPR